MTINFSFTSGCSTQNSCLSKDGCPPNVCPDFTIRRHDTKPALKISVADCDGPMDFRGLIVEANMWALAKLKADLDDSTAYFALADGIGFEQIMVGDMILMDRARLPERMLVVAFDENNKLVKVQRGYHGTTPQIWKKGSAMRIFRVLSAPAEAEIVLEDRTNPDGTVSKDTIDDSFLVYEWKPEDTCLAGCYWFEFKVLKMIDMVFYLPGGHWTGDVFQDVNGRFYTGTSMTDASVLLSLDQVTGYYLIPDTPWAGEVHLGDDAEWHTGTADNDGSVLLNKTGVPSADSIGYNHSGLAMIASLVPSFTDESLSPYYFGCILGEGVEWVRRFPTTGEGFLVKISDSASGEF